MSNSSQPILSFTPMEDISIMSLDRSMAIGVGIHGAIGGISAIVVMVLLCHLFVVAVIRRNEPASSGERVFVRTHIGWYFVCLLISDWLFSFGHFVQAFWAGNSAIIQGPMCTMQAVMIQYGALGTSWFTSVIAIHTFRNLVLKQQASTWLAITSVVAGWVFVIGADLVTMFTSQTPALGPFYGIAGHWCWIRSNYPLQRGLIHYLPMLLSAVISVLCYVMVFFSLRGNLEVCGTRVTFRKWNGDVANVEGYRTFLTALANRMLWYPISYIVLILPMTVIQLMTLTGQKTGFISWIVAGSVLATMGMVNAVIYTLTRNILPRSTSNASHGEGNDTLTFASFYDQKFDDTASGVSTLYYKDSYQNPKIVEPFPRPEFGAPPLRVQIPVAPPPALSSASSYGHVSPSSSVGTLVRHNANNSSLFYQSQSGHHSLPSYSSQLSASTIEARHLPAYHRNPFAHSYDSLGRVSPSEAQSVVRPITPHAVLALEMGNASRANSPIPLNMGRRGSGDDGASAASLGLAPPPRSARPYSPAGRKTSPVERAIKGVPPPHLQMAGPPSPPLPETLENGRKIRPALSAVVGDAEKAAIPPIPPTPTAPTTSLWQSEEDSTPSTPRTTRQRLRKPNPL